jgi:hypothetical protein
MKNGRDAPDTVWPENRPAEYRYLANLKAGYPGNLKAGYPAQNKNYY